MSIVYTCRHCGHKIGILKQQVVDTSMLGFDQLTVQQKQEMIQYKENGDIHVQSICEDCHETLELNPQYHELDNFIQ